MYFDIESFLFYVENREHEAQKQRKTQTATEECQI